MKNQEPEVIDFESALKELNTIVEQMEAGGLSLEQSLQSFERGINLTKQCQQSLRKAEQKVQLLLAQDGQTTMVDYKNEPDSENS